MSSHVLNESIQAALITILYTSSGFSENALECFVIDKALTCLFDWFISALISSIKCQKSVCVTSWMAGVWVSPRMFCDFGCFFGCWRQTDLRPFWRSLFFCWHTINFCCYTAFLLFYPGYSFYLLLPSSPGHFGDVKYLKNSHRSSRWGIQIACFVSKNSPKP